MNRPQLTPAILRNNYTKNVRLQHIDATEFSEIRTTGSKDGMIIVLILLMQENSKTS